MNSKGSLFLIPNLISEEADLDTLSQQTATALRAIRHFLVEDPRAARRYLSRLRIYGSIEELQFSVLDKDTPAHAMHELCQPLMNGHHIGIISASGCPGIADPGAAAVAYAHRNGIRVVPIPGPSAVLLALMAAGLNGQRFAFHGYLPIDSKKLSKVVKELERESKVKDQTQVCIETPYRNNTLMANLLHLLSPETKLCVAVDLTGESEHVAMRPVREWKARPVEFPKKPAIFLFLA